MDLQTLYLLEIPTKTIFGDIGYLRVTDYIDLTNEIYYLISTPLHIYYDGLKKLDSLDVELPEHEIAEYMTKLNVLKDMSIYELVNGDESVRNAYVKLFSKLITFNENLTPEDIINNENAFLQVRKIIMDMNYLKEDDVSPNPEIQEYFNNRKLQKAKESGGISFSDMVTSVAVSQGKSYSEIAQMTLFQFYNTYYRVAQFKRHIESVILAGAFHDTKIISSWSENINLFKDSELGIAYEEFNKKYKGVFEN